MFARLTFQSIARPVATLGRRSVSTLEGHPHIYVFPDPHGHILSLLPTSPPKPELAIGTTSKLPPTTDSLTENHKFLSILQAVLSENACKDPDVISQAQAMASTSGSNLGSGGAFFPQQRQRRKAKQGTDYGGGGGAGGDGAGGASSQGGAGGGGRGGWVHVSDQRNPPDYGRIAWPEDIFGSLEVDSEGNFVDGSGNYQNSGSYRVLTREGCLGLSPFLREKLVERLRQEEAKLR
ncbi:hypothetical protein LPUS_02078 [Lasallia pustulata]|uniref:Uncharacterized protein n=1 Tax=Lasallia pustulata TaxID=136370 RepID=A0A1W5CRZ8_9LECA|nr:hypothetical protein LPUS_02078 [Lasallia pustulata]